MQVALGRTDLRRAHHALSISFWAGVVLMLLGAAGYLHWIFAAGPGDLRSSFVTGSDASRRWIEVVGSAERSKCFGQDLLVDTRSGRYLPQMTASVLFESSRSARGRQLVFAGRAELAARWVTGADGRSTALALVDLGADHPRLSQVTLEGTAAPRWSTLLRLSPSGATALLVGESGAASLFETRSGRGLASTTVPAGFLAVDAVFSSETEARVWLASKPVRRVLEVAVGGRALWSDFAMPASWPGAGPAAAYALTPLRGGSRVLSFDNGVRLRDGKTGALVATLVEGGKSWGIGALADGRITVTTAREGREWLAVFDPDGVRLREVDLGPAGPTTNSAEVAPGRVAVGIGRRSEPGQTVVVDVDAGESSTDSTGCGRRPVG